MVLIARIQGDCQYRLPGVAQREGRALQTHPAQVVGDGLAHHAGKVRWKWQGE